MRYLQRIVEFLICVQSTLRWRVLQHRVDSWGCFSGQSKSFSVSATARNYEAPRISISSPQGISNEFSQKSYRPLHLCACSRKKVEFPWGFRHYFPRKWSETLKEINMKLHARNTFSTNEKIFQMKNLWKKNFSTCKTLLVHRSMFVVH